MSEDYLKVFLQNMEKERQGKVESGELIQPVEKKLSPVELEENILPEDPDPGVDENKAMKQLRERWLNQAKIRFPDDEEKQKKYIQQMEERNEIQKEYATQIAGGVFDAGNAALNFTVNRFLDEDSKILLPEIEAPKTTGQALVRGGSQFMIPYLGWFKILKGVSVGSKLIIAIKGTKLSWKKDLALGSGAGAITDVIHFEANDPTLSNLIETYPHLANPITEYLQTNPDDPEGLNRFKRAIEGAGLGNFLAVIMRGIGHGFTKVGDKTAEKVVRHAIDKRTRALAPVKDKNGKNIHGRWQARLAGKTINVTKKKGVYEVEVDGVVFGTFKTLKDVKNNIKNVEKHHINVDEGLKGKEKLKVENNDFDRFFNVDKRSAWQRTKDKWNSWQIQSWLAIKGFDQYHGIKLVNQALSKQKLDKGGYESLRMYKEARLLAAVSGSLEHLLKHGSFKWAADGDLVKVGKPLNQILQPLEKNLDDWLNFVAAKRILNLKRFDKKLGKWVLDKKKVNEMFPDKATRKIIEEQANKGSTPIADGRTYDDVLKEFDEFNEQILDFAEQSGILSKDHRFKLKQSPHYISLYRDFKGDAFANTKFSRGASSALSKKLKGARVAEAGKETQKGFVWDEGKQKLVWQDTEAYPFRDFLEGYLENIFGIVKSSHRNKVNMMMGKALQRFVDDAEKDYIAQGVSKADAKLAAEEHIAKIWGKRKQTFKMEPKHVDASANNIRAQLQDMGLALEDADLSDIIFYAPSRIKIQDNQFIFAKNVGDGRELEMWELSNPFLAESMMAVGDRIVKAQNMFLGVGRQFKNLLTRGVTWDPGFFMYANFLRDSVSSSVLSKDGFFGIGGGTIPIVSSGKGLIQQVRTNSKVMGKDGKALKNFDGSDMKYKDLWNEFTLNGAGFDSTLMRSSLQENRVKHIYEQMGLDYKFVINRSKYMRGRGVKGAKKVLNGLDDAVGVFEYASRFAEYHRLRKLGVNAREAAYQAREIATDFAMHGTGSLLHFFTQTVPFLNAGLQGLYRTIRAFKGEGLTQSQRTLMAAKISSAILVPTMFFRWINRDNPEYERLTQHTRDMHWVMPKPDWMPGKGGHILIPKPFEWGALSTVVDRAWDTWGPEEVINPITKEKIRWLESDTYFTNADFAEVFSKILSEQMRLNLMPQIISPIGGLLTNQRFTGSPIVPSFMKDYLPLESQDYPWSNAAILSAFRKNPQWSNWAGLSPVAVEHLMKSYTGTLGAYVMDFIIDPAFREGGIDLGGLPPRPDITGYGFGTWDNAPLVKRMFVGETPRHTEAIIKSYQLKNEVTKRMNQLKKMEKEGLHDELVKLMDDPYMKDIIALDKGLQGYFAQLEELAKAEKIMFSKRWPGTDTAEARGKELQNIRKHKIELTNEMLDMLEGYNLDYVIPRKFTLPFTRTTFQVRTPHGQNINLRDSITSSPTQTWSGTVRDLWR